MNQTDQNEGADGQANGKPKGKAEKKSVCFVVKYLS